MTIRTALVTGSARRVGRRVAEALIADGWLVVVHASDEARAVAATGELGAVAGLGADLGNAGAVIDLAARVSVIVEGRLDLLVNCAATFERVEHWQDVELDSWARAMDVNARAPYLLTGELLPALTAAHGSVINVSDRAAHEHWPNYPVHAASKAALESLTLSSAKALAREGVRVNAVVPGTILPPDDWDASRIEQERAAGSLQTPELLIDAIRGLADSESSRTGEIVRL